jgi:lipopolysaccharide transport system permease protein
MTQSSQSLVDGQRMLGKIYFPRIAFPITPIFARLIDFGISIIIILLVLLYYRVVPTFNLFALPIFFLVMIIVPAGLGMWLAALAIRFRDVKHIMPFVIRMMVYTAPIVYSAKNIPEKYRLVYSINPLVSVIEGYRACLLGTPIPWEYVIPGIFTAILIFVGGALYFRRMERIFVDVI